MGSGSRVMGVPPGPDRVTAHESTVRDRTDGLSTVTSAAPSGIDATADAVGRLRRAWQAARSGTRSDPPDLAMYLPDSDTLRRHLLERLIAVDLQERWLRARLPKRLPEYCAEFADLEQSRLSADLIYEEFCIRRQSGDTVLPRDYLAEYPSRAGELAELLNTMVGEDTAAHTIGADPDSTMESTMESIRSDTSSMEETGRFTGELTETSGNLLRTRPGSQDQLEDLDVGDRLDDFDLLVSVGRGAFARVFLARQRSMQRIVAVKISEDRGSEPQTLAQLDHDYIVRVFDQRVLVDRRLRLLYMQYVPGGTLLGLLGLVKATPPSELDGTVLLSSVNRSLQDTGGLQPTDSTVREHISTLSWPETVAWLGRRLAEALHYAGEHGVLHRDIKPANVLLTAEGVPKLADFNISFSDAVEGDSPVAYFGGSLSYMSPEQLEACHPGRAGRAEDLDTRSDLYSLAVVLWELLTGVKPFDDSAASAADGDRTTIDVLLTARRAGVTSAALAALPADCPATLRRVLLKCLAPDPDDRLATGQELAQQFDLCLDAHARTLVDPPTNSTRFRVRPFTIPVMTAAIGIPNVIAAIYNYQHNKALIIGDLLPAAQERFDTVTALINGLAWPIGLVLIVYFFRRILSVPKALRSGRSVSDAQLTKTRSDTLLVADRVVAVCLGLWICAGIAFPVSLQIAAGAVPAQAYVHFVASLVVCGAMATAYPFFLISLFTIRCLYPSLLPFGAGERDEAMLAALNRRSVGYLTVAAAIPLVAVAGLTFVPAADIPSIIGVVRVVCVGGIAAFVASYSVFRLLEKDNAALRRVVGGK